MSRPVNHPGGQRPIMRMVKDILDYLDPHNGKRIDQIAKDLPIEISPELIREVRANPRVRFDQDKELYFFKPLFMLRNEKELKEKLLQTPEGLREEDLKRSYHGIQEDIEVMIRKGEAIGIVDTETKQRILFPYDARYNVPVFPEFQTMWASIRVPDDVDLEKEMQRAGISMMAQTKITRKRPLKQKKTRQRRFRKVTNVHMEPIVDQ